VWSKKLIYFKAILKINLIYLNEFESVVELSAHDRDLDQQI
jgi:hypothetical protein